MGGISWHIKTYSYDFFFNAARDSLSKMWDFYLNPCLVSKLANVVKYYIIYIPAPVIHWLCWYIDTVKIVEKNVYPLTLLESTGNILNKYL